MKRKANAPPFKRTAWKSRGFRWPVSRDAELQALQSAKAARSLQHLLEMLVEDAIAAQKAGGSGNG